MNVVNPLRRSTLLLTLTIAFSYSTVASAFYVEGLATTDDAGAPVLVRWAENTPVTYRIAAGGIPGTEGDDSEFAAVTSAFSTWSQEPCTDIQFTEGDRVADTAIERKHWETDQQIYVLVYWSADETFWVEGPMVGKFVSAHDGTGVLIGATIVLNAFHHQWSTTGEAGKMDVQSIVTAMIGRSLGITSGQTGNATYPSYTPGDISKRTLGSDDKAAVAYLYPKTGAEGCTITAPEEVCMPADPECPPVSGPSLPPPGMNSGNSPDAGTFGDESVDSAGSSDGGGCSCSIKAGEDSAWGALSIALLFGLLWYRKRTASQK